MTFQAKYTDEQRSEAIELVGKLSRAAGKRRGAVAAAATQLGLHPSIVAYWVSAATNSAAKPKAVETRPTHLRHGLIGLVWCGLCGRLMVLTRTHLGVPALGCPDRCRRRTGVLITDVERVIGRMILERLSVAGRPALNQMTISTAAAQAPRLLDRIVVGSRADAMRVRWRLAPLRVFGSDHPDEQVTNPLNRVNGARIPAPRAPTSTASSG
jgi:hypothetical protein